MHALQQIDALGEWGSDLVVQWKQHEGRGETLLCTQSPLLACWQAEVSSTPLQVDMHCLSAAVCLVLLHVSMPADLQMVNMSLRLLSKPNEDKLSNIFKVCMCTALAP